MSDDEEAWDSDPDIAGLQKGAQGLGLNERKAVDKEIRQKQKEKSKKQKAKDEEKDKKIEELGTRLDEEGDRGSFCLTFCSAWSGADFSSISFFFLFFFPVGRFLRSDAPRAGSFNADN